MPDITRLFKGPANDFEVEIVFAESGERSPKESHPFDEIIVVTAGAITIERSDEGNAISCTAPGFIEIPAGVEHVVGADSTPTKVVVIHPDRRDG